MKAQITLLTAGLVGGLGVGWLTAPMPNVSATTAAQPPALVHASVEARDARQRLDRLGLAPQPVVEAPPPPPDIAILFRRDLTAIEDRGAGRVVWIVDYAQTHQRRALRIGDVYQDGWRVSRIGAQSVELRRRREVRSVDAFALPVIEP
ncbi:MAG: hypothetical protein ABL889_04070 [Terricaulis sp.]